MVETNGSGPNWRRLQGIDREEVPASYIGRILSTSTEDKRRGSFRGSKFPGFFTIALVNDDETPITQETDRLLALLLEEIAALRAEVAGLRAELREV